MSPSRRTALVSVGCTEVSLHVKLPGAMSLADAHEVAESLEAAIRATVPTLDAVRTHLEPLTEPAEATEGPGEDAMSERISLDATGSRPRELRLLRTDASLVTFLTLGLDATATLDAAHTRASEIEARIRVEAPEIADVIVHIEL